MEKVVLISCVSKKLTYKAKAKEFYISQLFKYNLQYASMLKPNKIFILSAKHGLLNLDDEIDPYDITLNKMSSKEVKGWAEEVLISLEQEIDLDTAEVIFLAGEKYRKHLLPKIKHYQIPLEGLPIGKQLQFLKEAVR